MTFHGVLLDDRSEDAYEHFLEVCSRGLYNTNALEAQLDLLYTYCQYELHRQQPDLTHLTLYRGFNRFSDDQVLTKPARRRWIVLLNNLSSFSVRRERAEGLAITCCEPRFLRPRSFSITGFCRGC